MLAGLVLVLGLAVVPTVLRLAQCPTCEGQGLVAEPAAGAAHAQWLSGKDLVHVECGYCRDSGKVSLLQRWRWDPKMAPAPPTYRRGGGAAFVEQRRRRVTLLCTEVIGGSDSAKPGASTRRPDLLPVLAAALGDEDGRVRGVAAAALAQAAHESGVPFLLEALKHPDLEVRRWAGRGLADFADHPRLGTQVIAELRRVSSPGGDPDFDVRYIAASALFEHGQPVDSSIFVEALRGDHDHSPFIARTIAALGRKDAIYLLIRRMALLSPGNPDAAPAREALETLTGERLGDDPVRWYRWLEKNRSRFPPQVE